MPEVECQTDLTGEQWFKTEDLESNMHIVLQRSKEIHRVSPFTGNKPAFDVGIQVPDADVCPFCFIKFYSLFTRNKHVDKRTCLVEPAKTRSFNCEHCKKRFKSQQKLNYHLENQVCNESKLSKIIKNGYSCSLCGDIMRITEDCMEEENNNGDNYFNSKNISVVLNYMMTEHCHSGECKVLQQLSQLARNTSKNVLWSECFSANTKNAKIPQVYEWMTYDNTDFKLHCDTMMVLIRKERITQNLRNQLKGPNRKKQKLFLDELLGCYPILPEVQF